MIIDFHHHLLSGDGYVKKMVAAMDASGIDKVCLSGLGVPSANWLGDTSPGNEDVEAATREHPGRIVPIGVVRLGVDTPEKIVELHEKGFIGLKTTRPLFNYDDPRLDEMYAKAEELRMPVLFHTGFIVGSCCDARDDVSSARTQPVLLDRVARRFPELKIVMAHLGMPWFEEAAQMCRFHDNVFADLSGSLQGWRNRLAPRELGDLLYWPGAMSKIVFGSDVSHEELDEATKDYLRILSLLNVDQETRDAVMGGTAASFLGLK